MPGVDHSSHEQRAYDELALYTLAHGDPAFIHQHVVDAFAAQRADGQTKPITLTFALIGLYLHVERHFTGKQVQRVHMLLARRRKGWPTFAQPSSRGDVSVFDVLQASPGAERDAAIDRWCTSVWRAYAAVHQQVADLLHEVLG
jgi:hypothetical protein